MSKTKSITDLVTELQNENESLKGLKKGFNTMCKAEFGYSIDELHSIHPLSGSVVLHLIVFPSSGMSSV